jgi:hypothetical protein
MVTRSRCFEYGSRCRRWAACSRHPSASASRARTEPLDLHQQPLPQAGLAVHRGDRVQRHPGQQPPFGRVQIRVRAGISPAVSSRHQRLRLCKLTTLGMRPGTSRQQA